MQPSPGESLQRRVSALSMFNSWGGESTDKWKCLSTAAQQVSVRANSTARHSRLPAR